MPFGGGTGAGVSINPVAFLVIQEGSVKLLPVNHSSAIDRLLDYVPDLFEKANEMMKKNANIKKEIENKVTEKVDKEIKKQEKEKSKKEKKEPKEETVYEFEYDETDDENKDENEEDD